MTPIPQGWAGHNELHKEMQLCDKMVERYGLLVRTDWAGRFNAASEVHRHLPHDTHLPGDLRDLTRTA